MIIGSIPLLLRLHTIKFQIIPDWSIFDWGLMAFASIFGGAIAWIVFLLRQ